MSKHDIADKFYEALASGNFNEAANLVEDYAKYLAKEKRISSNSLNKLQEIINRMTGNEGNIDIIFIRSEILELKIDHLSEVLAELVRKRNKENVDLLKKLINALINFYKYYSGE